MKWFGGLFKFLEGIALFALAFWLISWYIKGHFNKKYFLFFWLNTIVAIFMYFHYQQKIKDEYDPRSGYEIWQENMRGK